MTKIYVYPLDMDRSIFGEEIRALVAKPQIV